MNSKQTETESRIEISETDPAVIILWLHGLGADGYDFVSLADELELGVRVRFVFPHAPRRRVTLNAGMTMRAWYDIVELNGFREDEAGIREAVAWVHSWLDEERINYPKARLFLGGFSQGGALALASALRYPQPLAGIVALSAYLPIASKTSSERQVANQKTPIWMSHGQMDPVLAYGFGLASSQQLLALGYELEFKSYWMAHQVIPDELNDLSLWIQRQISKKKG